MSLDLTGISNENEFYTQYYLSELLEKDISGLFAEMEAEDSPIKGFQSLGKDYFRTLDVLKRSKDHYEHKTALLSKVLITLGYDFHEDFRYTLASEVSLVVSSTVRKSDGSYNLLAIFVDSHGDDPLESKIGDLISGENKEAFVKDRRLQSVEDLVGEVLFGSEEPPRWLLVLSYDQIILVDRLKWNQKRLLRFQLDEILGRKESSTIRATVSLLHRSSVCPDTGSALLDDLDEKSHKNAFAVSEDLKLSLREAIELLGNEVVYSLREKHVKIYDDGMDQKLTRECLRFMYRLMFLFYIEARPELGYAPMGVESYLNGYSLEKLRDLAEVEYETEEALNGYGLHESVRILFSMVQNGFAPSSQLGLLKAKKCEETEVLHNIFSMSALNSHLFDEGRTPLLKTAKIRNFVMQRIIRLLSLSRAGKKGRGRISYSALGINQLGAVYEALLSYTGFFAKELLYEVKPAKQKEIDELETGYFVNVSQFEEYSEDERVYNSDGSFRQYPAGTFIYRLAGRERDKSASYYTPEVLTRCLVHFALKDLLEGKSADEILKLNVCEPAMGSAAFLNEAVNQLAQAYLERKQSEEGMVPIPHADYEQELQKVKMHLADNNVFGVDLNPVATELAEVSLWLNTIHQGAFVPWFGLQLFNGNSLVGARHQWFGQETLRRKDYLKATPENLELNAGSSKWQDKVLHFLVPAEGMAKYEDKVIKKLVPEELKKIKEWQTDFMKPFAQAEINQLLELSKAARKLWGSHANKLAQIRSDTTDEIQIYGQKKKNRKNATSTAFKDGRYVEDILRKEGELSSSYQRLKLAMDLWCALWFWPINEHETLPDRNKWLLLMNLILMGQESGPTGYSQTSLPGLSQPTQKPLVKEALEDEHGLVKLDSLKELFPELKIVQELRETYKFFHWELEFADIFMQRGGFDLVLGNPPWLKVEWQEAGIIGDVDPKFVIRKLSAKQTADLREDVLEGKSARACYFEEYEGSAATKNFLNSVTNYHELIGQKANLYKCFLPLAWRIGSKKGYSAFVHPEGVYDDPKGGLLRAQIYPRLRYHFQFRNATKLFSEVHDGVMFSLNVYKSTGSVSPYFEHISNLYSSATIGKSFEHDGNEEVPGNKDDAGNWAIEGHRDRIVKVSINELELFAKLYDEPGTPGLQARLPNVHSTQIVDVLRKFAAQPKRLGDLKGQYYSTQHWNETNSQKDGTLTKRTEFPKSPKQWVLSGPHFYVGNPFNKTPKAVCDSNQAYHTIDLTNLPEDYLPRTNYVPACSEEEYLKRTPRVPWGDQKPVTEFYRMANRGMLSQSGERTFISAMIPKYAGHINGVQTIVFKSSHNLVSAYTFGISLLADFFIKTTGKANLHYLWARFPFLNLPSTLIKKSLGLVGLTQDYKELTELYEVNSRILTDFERRKALIEIDVGVSISLGLTIEELKTIYRIQFPVLQQNEQDTWYDQKGRIVFTASKGLPGVGLPRKYVKGETCYLIESPERTETAISLGWEDIRDMKSGVVYRQIEDDTLPGGPIQRTIEYHAPFYRCDREKDYEVAWDEFARRGYGNA